MVAEKLSFAERRFTDAGRASKELWIWAYPIQKYTVITVQSAVRFSPCKTPWFKQFCDVFIQLHFFIFCPNFKILENLQKS